jgi:hypothetical protein
VASGTNSSQRRNDIPNTFRRNEQLRVLDERGGRIGSACQRHELLDDALVHVGPLLLGAGHPAFRPEIEIEAQHRPRVAFEFIRPALSLDAVAIELNRLAAISRMTE